jgi:hypothetical protein
MDKSEFRLSEGAFLNDPIEGRELFHYLGYHSTAHGGQDNQASLFVRKPFIGSFVPGDQKNNLTLWRMYGKESDEEGKGCCLTLKRRKLIYVLEEKLASGMAEKKELKGVEGFHFYKVAYHAQKGPGRFFMPGGNSEEEDELNSLMDNLKKMVKAVIKKNKSKAFMTDLQELLNQIAYLFKSTDFMDEKEVRLIIKGAGFERKFQPGAVPPRVYIDMVAIHSAIVGVTLGPKVERANEWASAFYYSLEKEGVEAEILCSQLTYK